MPTLNPGCHELLDTVRKLGIRTALITRNSPLSVQTVVRRHALELELMITRDDARPKPEGGTGSLTRRRHMPT